MDRHTIPICGLSAAKHSMTHVNASSVSKDIGRISSTTLRAKAHVTTMRVLAHVTTMRTGIEQRSNVDNPVPRASRR